jgi:hypothetical protein
MHYDLSYNFFVQITGTKTFLLLPPENHKNIYMFPRVHPHHRRSQANLTAIDLEVFPKFAEVTGALEVRPKRRPIFSQSNYNFEWNFIP